MKNNWSLCFLSVFIMEISCTSVRRIANQEITLKNNVAQLSFSRKTPLLTVYVDNNDARFIFDTGATVSVLHDSTIVSNFTNRTFDFFLSAKGADGKKIRNRKISVLLSSALFESPNKVLTYINTPLFDCSARKPYSGIVGMDVFFADKKSLQMDFTKNTIANISQEQLQKAVTAEDYKLVKSSCKLGQIRIFLSVEGVEYPFLLDTGYSGAIIFPEDKKRVFKNNSKLELEGSIFQTVSATTQGKETIYENMPIRFSDYDFDVKINVSSSIKAQNIGIEFIKAFDWLIDYNHNKVYVKRNQNKIEDTFKRTISYYAKTQEGKLLVSVKEKSQTRFNLGDQIIAVNGHKVLPENICQLMDLLNKTEDWNTLKIETIPVQR